MAITGVDVVTAFELCCKEQDRLFIPDIPRQEAVSESLAAHYNSDDLLDAIKWFAKNTDGPFLLFEFALKSRDIVERIRRDRLSHEKFKDLVAQTRKLIQTDDEL
jgi:hypothetical protein